MEEYNNITVGTVLHHQYRIECLIGQGGTANTYRAVQLSTNSSVAIKQFTQYKERFEQEVAILRKYQYLDGIVSILDCFVESGSAYIVMDYIEGITLKQYIMENGCMHPNVAFSLFLPIMKSLGLLHKQGVLHRDISPDNLIIDLHNRLWLIDFGAAGLSSNERTLHLDSDGNSMNQTVIIKAGYTPYEQYVTDGKIGSWTDVYALSATIYTACSGNVPPDALARIHGEQLLKIDTMSKWQWETLQKGMAISYEERYQNMGEFIADLTFNPAEHTDTLGVTIYPEHITDYTGQLHSSQYSKHYTGSKVSYIKWVVLLFLCVVVILFGSIWFSLYQKHEREIDLRTQFTTKDTSIDERNDTNQDLDQAGSLSTEDESYQEPTTISSSTSTHMESSTSVQKQSSATTEATYQIEEKSDYDEFELGD